MQLRSGRVYLVMLLFLTSCDSPERHDDLPPHYKRMGDLSPHLKIQPLTTFAGTDSWYHGRCQPFPPSIAPILLPLPCLRAHSPTTNTKHNIDTHLRFQHTGIQPDFNIDFRIQRTNSKPNAIRNLRLRQRIQMLSLPPPPPTYPDCAAALVQLPADAALRHFHSGRAVPEESNLPIEKTYGPCRVVIDLVDRAKEDQEKWLEISYRAALLTLACENPSQIDKFYGGITHAGFLERIVGFLLAAPDPPDVGENGTVAVA